MFRYQIYLFSYYFHVQQRITCSQPASQNNRRCIQSYLPSLPLSHTQKIDKWITSMDIGGLQVILAICFVVCNTIGNQCTCFLLVCSWTSLLVPVRNCLHCHSFAVLLLIIFISLVTAMTTTMTMISATITTCYIPTNK